MVVLSTSPELSGRNPDLSYTQALSLEHRTCVRETEHPGMIAPECWEHTQEREGLGGKN